MLHQAKEWSCFSNYKFWSLISEILDENLGMGQKNGMLWKEGNDDRQLLFNE
jgi:hypothetical protein